MSDSDFGNREKKHIIHILETEKETYHILETEKRNISYIYWKQRKETYHILETGKEIYTVSDKVKKRNRSDR